MTSRGVEKSPVLATSRVIDKNAGEPKLQVLAKANSIKPTEPNAQKTPDAKKPDVKK